ncbi:MAG: hypothetical protein GXO81_09060 [Chlorobi bacterium]|nr:hypothetical protein [Chlorobiota bacterium]
MRFFIDANLPFKLSKNLKDKGNDVLHTDDLPNQEKTSDNEIRRVSLNENRIIITKDSDFLDSHILQGVPQKLLLVTTGNITNKELFLLFERYFEDITKLFDIYDLIEINNEQIIGHEKMDR